MAISSIQLVEMLPASPEAQWNVRFSVGFDLPGLNSPFFANITVGVANAENLSVLDVRNRALHQLKKAIDSIHETPEAEFRAIYDKGAPEFTPQL